MTEVFVRCSRCGKQVSNVVTPVDGSLYGIVVRAWVECPKCIEQHAPDESEA